MKLEQSILIERALEEVFAYVSNPVNDAEWVAGRVESLQTSTGPLGIGTTILVTNKFLGRQFSQTIEATEYEVNRKVSYKSITGPLPVSDHRIFERAGTATLVTLQLDGEPGGFFKLADPILAVLGRKQFETDLASLKTILEAPVPAGT